MCSPNSPRIQIKANCFLFENKIFINLEKYIYIITFDSASLIKSIVELITKLIS